jgi:exosortase
MIAVTSSSAGSPRGEPRCASFRSLASTAQFNLLALGLLLAALCGMLWRAWGQDPELAHGRVVPLLFAILLYESRSRARPRFLQPRPSLAWVAGAFALAGLAAIVGGGLYAAVLDWTHAFVEALLGAGVTALLVAGWIALADARVRWVPFNWPAGAAIALWPLAAPIPPGTYSRLAGALQQAVTAGVVQTLQLCGIAAYREGNVIELARTIVGVSEACSGVRGLIACLATGLFLSGALLTRPRDRVIVIGAAPVLALSMNFIRSLLLTLIANAGINIAGEWHDATGYTIIGVTSLLLVALAWRLQARRPERGTQAAAVPTEAPPPAPSETLPSRNLPTQAILTAALAVTGALAVVFGLATHPFGPASGRAPDVTSLLPAAPPGWTSHSETDFSAWSGVLKTDVLAMRTYLRPTAAGGDQITLYVAYWRPGQAPVSLVSSHTPDACWPGVGWVATPLSSPRQPLAVDGRTLPPAECRLFQNGAYREYVWYWHLYAGRPIQEEDPYTLRHLLHLALTYGYRHDGDQWFVRASSNRPWDEIAAQPTVVAFFGRLQPFGL